MDLKTMLIDQRMQLANVIDQLQDGVLKTRHNGVDNSLATVAELKAAQERLDKAILSLDE